MKYFVLAITLVALASGYQSEDVGKYVAYRENNDDGSYNRPSDEGKYVHIPNPYGGGYGPYSGDWERYKHIGDELDGSASDRKQVTVRPSTTPYPTIKYVNNGNKIIRHDQNLKDDGYKYTYETENKILAQENAVITNPNTPDEGIASSGFYQYVGPDGVLYRVTFTADENGFRPKMTRVKYPESLDDGFTKTGTNNIRK